MSVGTDEARRLVQAELERVDRLIATARDQLDLDEEAVDGEMADYDQHGADQASDVVQRDQDLAILAGLEAERAELAAAAARIDAGTYGVDEVTGEPIDPERLRAMPAARTNVGTDPNAARSPGAWAGPSDGGRAGP